MAEWVNTIITSMGTMFSTLYDPENVTIATCSLIPVVAGIAAFCTKLVKRGR
jgi:hypothetical protein